MNAPLPPLDLSHHISRTTKKRGNSLIKDFYKYFSIPGIGNLAGGLPNESYFPYDTLEARVAHPTRFSATSNYPLSSSIQVDSAADAVGRIERDSSSILVPKTSGTTDVLRRIDLSSALQYGTAQGYPPLYQYLRHFTRENLHPNVPYAGGPEIILTCGNTDGFAKTVELLSNEWVEEKDWIREREGILVEEFCYMAAAQAARPKGLQIVPVALDAEGMRDDGPGGLADVLANWDDQKGKRPHLLYTVTIGQNPTGGVLSVERRIAIYKICHEYDVIIIEDDPYWYLQYPSAVEAVEQKELPLVDTVPRGNIKNRSSGYEFLDSLVPSYLSVDTDGRVVRLDTFSKTIAPGCRLGWITTQPLLIERLQRITEVSTQQPSGFVQSMVAELLIGPKKTDDGGHGSEKDGRGWDTDGWVRWLAGLRSQYEGRMQTMSNILEDGKYTVLEDRQASTGSWSILEKVKMYDFVKPRGGMFLWLQLNLSSHPLYDQISAAKLSHALWVHLTTHEFLVLVAPATIFAPTKQILETKAPHFFRLCFAAVNVEDVEKISKRVVAGFNSFWAKKSFENAILEGCNHM
ncbi:MAG: hypothetical protein M1833_006807 [Piccolia ochrophora]|nr:MAG: hypothetical protein M1833_006807 [Piccolia ochrophora]